MKSKYKFDIRVNDTSGFAKTFDGKIAKDLSYLEMKACATVLREKAFTKEKIYKLGYYKNYIAIKGKYFTLVRKEIL